MPAPALRFAVIVALALVVATLGWPCTESHPARPELAPLDRGATHLPAAFVPNRGQWRGPTRFAGRGSAWRATFAAAHVDVASALPHAPRIRLAFEGGHPAPEITGVTEQPGVHNFLVGERSAWRTGVRSFNAIRYHGVYDGIDVRFRDERGQLEYDLELAAGADVDRVVVRCSGVDALDLDDRGALVMRCGEHLVRQTPPTTFEVLPSGERRPVACRFRLLGDDRFGFAVPHRDPTVAMVVDPGLEWSTYIGSSRYDYANDIAIAQNGDVILCGYTSSSGFPKTAGAFDTTLSGNDDAFVARLNATGSALVFSTYLGGSATEEAMALALTPIGDIVVTGVTQSSNFPTTNGAYDRSYAGNGDAFIVRLSAAGNALQFGTFLGGGGFDEPADIAISSTGSIAVTGLTQSTNFPTTAGAFDSTFNGRDDAFVARLDANATQLLASTYLGGSESEPGEAVAIDGNDVITVAGDAWGVNNTSNFPTTTGAYDTTYNGGTSDTFVARVNATGGLVYSTFLGGTNWDPARDLHLHADGSVTIAGQTYSANFPATTGAFQTTYAGKGDVYVARLNPTGTALDYATFIGGTDFDEAIALDVDPAGGMTVAGWSKSNDYPTTVGSIQSTHKGGGDNLISRLSPNGAALRYSTLLGGAKWEQVHAITADGTNAITIAGQVWSNDYPTTAGAIDRTYNTNGDVFVTRLDMLPTGVSKIGASAPSCQGPIAIGVTKSPTEGTTGFAITSINAQPNNAGIVVLATSSFPSGFQVGGATAYLNPGALVAAFTVISDATGAAALPLPVPVGGKGVTVYAQVFWPHTPSCPGNGVIAASNAIAITIQ